MKIHKVPFTYVPDVRRYCNGGCGRSFMFHGRDTRKAVPAFCVVCQKPVLCVRLEEKEAA